MATALSVNLNKIALLRNSRGRDYPNVVSYAHRCIDLGVQGITIHPRQDERHAKKQDAHDLAELCDQFSQVELNIEGFPSDTFLTLIEETKPDQCTLVPDDENQLTSDHGWNILANSEILDKSLNRIKAAGIRSALFIDPIEQQIVDAASTGCDRIELYTAHYANTFDQDNADVVLESYRAAAQKAQSLGLGVNAGHDLDLSNLSRFLQIENILEVSIGHALTIESIDQGMHNVISQYLKICNCS